MTITKSRTREARVIPILLVDDSPDSTLATQILRNSHTLPFLVMRSSADAIPTPPALLTYNRVIKGSAAIADYLQAIGRQLSVENQRIRTTFAALKRIGVSLSLATFNDRLRMQKVVYLLQSFGLQTRWNFSWYLRGPYSSDLAYAVFNTDLKSVSEVKFNRANVRAIEKLKRYFKLEYMSVADLEASASILYVATQRREPWESKQELVEEVLSKKPMLARSRVAKYVSELWSEIPHRS